MLFRKFNADDGFVVNDDGKVMCMGTKYKKKY